MLVKKDQITQLLLSFPILRVKRISIMFFLLIMQVTIIIKLFDRSILFWVIVLWLISYFSDWKSILNRFFINSAGFKLSLFLFLLFTIVFSFTEVDWKYLNWLKSYTDWGTIVFILFVLTVYIFHLSRNIIRKLLLIVLMFVPLFVILQMPILADTYAVFAFLLVTCLVFIEVREVRKNKFTYGT